MSKNLKKIGLALLTIIVLGFAFYNFYWVKTPQYSLMLIQKAIQTHNVNSFEQSIKDPKCSNFEINLDKSNKNNKQMLHTTFYTIQKYFDVN